MISKTMAASAVSGSSRTQTPEADRRDPVVKEIKRALGKASYEAMQKLEVKKVRIDGKPGISIRGNLIGFMQEVARNYIESYIPKAKNKKDEILVSYKLGREETEVPTKKKRDVKPSWWDTGYEV